MKRKVLLATLLLLSIVFAAIAVNWLNDEIAMSQISIYDLNATSESLSDARLGKINWWLWNETMHWLEIDPYHKISVILWVDEMYLIKQGFNQTYVADILQTQHNATIKMIGKYLSCIIAYIPAIEVQKIAQYPFIESMGSGTRPLYTIPPNEAPRLVYLPNVPWPADSDLGISYSTQLNEFDVTAGGAAFAPAAGISYWLWNDAQKWLKIDPYHKVSVIVWVSYGISQTYVANILETRHNATIKMIGKYLSCIIAYIPAIEVQKIAQYPFIESMGSGTYPIGGIPEPRDVKIIESPPNIWPDYPPPRASAQSTDSNSTLEPTYLINSTATIRAPDVWAMGYRGTGIKIAIIDTGVNTTLPDGSPRPDLFFPNGTSKVVYQRDFTNDNDTSDLVEYGHGTWVAVTAAGADRFDFYGTAPEALILNIKVINRTKQAEPQWVVGGIEDALENGAKIINLSLGFPPTDGTDDVSKAADEAVENGAVVVAAAGNEGPSPRTIRSPGCAFNVITVGAVAANNTPSINDDLLWYYSSRGPTLDDRTKPDVVAPGVWQVYQYSQTHVIIASGTSLAAPHVSGVTALLLQAHPDWTPNLVKDALRRTARLNTNLEGLSENDRGKGIIDAFAAVQSQPDGTFGWDPYQVRSMDKTTVVYNVTRVENVPCLRNVQLTGFQIVNVAAAPYLWLDGQEYKMSGSLLISGPRVFYKTPTATRLKFVYRVNGLTIPRFYEVSKTLIQSSYEGDMEWLDYWDLDLHGSDHDYTWSNGSIIWNEVKLVSPSLYYIYCNDTQYFQPLITWASAGATVWVLRYHGGFTNNPDNYLNGESVYDANLVIYQRSPNGWAAPTMEVITQDMALPNKSFEEVDEPTGSRGALLDWSTNNGGRQEIAGDVNHDHRMTLADVGKMDLCYSGVIPGPPYIDPSTGKYLLPDVNGDGAVTLIDVALVDHYYSGLIKWPLARDGDHSWYTSGGGDYLMWQWLDSDAVSALAGHTVMFSFWFNPESATSDGKQDNARAEIYYEYDGGSNIFNGSWIQPTERGWWYAYVTVSLPLNLTKVQLRIHGTDLDGAPDFKAWIDLAQLYLIK
jgi:serine protease AprX